MSCRCEEPVHSINPRHENHCVKCSKLLTEPEYAPSDGNLGAFFDTLAECAIPAYGRTLDRKTIPQTFFNFFRDCQGRMRAGNGKPEYKYRYLARDNPRESQEEAADLANYLFLETLRRRRLGQDEEADIALTGAVHAYKAWEAAQRMATHSYIPFSDTDQDSGLDPETPHPATAAAQ